MNTRAHSFPPVIDGSVGILILGSVPGIASLRANQYYAHPRNGFWPIMQRILGFSEEATYVQKTEALKQNGIGLWDVMQSCERSGSLDANINAQTIEPNDFAALFREFPSINRVLFNGLTAEKTFKKRVLPALSGAAKDIELFRLPSTSPAMASMSVDQKLVVWSVAITDVRQLNTGFPGMNRVRV